jgi:hypothetical protein
MIPLAMPTSYPPRRRETFTLDDDSAEYDVLHMYWYGEDGLRYPLAQTFTVDRPLGEITAEEIIAEANTFPGREGFFKLGEHDVMICGPTGAEWIVIEPHAWTEEECEAAGIEF